MIDSIAVIGYSGRFPGARDPETLWANLRQGVESITFFTREELLEAGVDPALLADPNYVPAAAALDDVESFDAAFFGYSPREAEVMDPQQRVFLEVAHAALERSGYEPRAYAGRIGVYAGMGMNTYLLRNLLSHPGLIERIGPYQALISSDKDFLATRVSYKLNLRGPSVTVQSACSTSLVAVAMACQSLMNAECDMAMAGGVTVRVPQRSGYLYQEEGILSPDGHCRPFDAAARGTVPGSGAAVVVLKRLSDAIQDRDHIHAVIRGWATNNDGSQKAGYTAPSVEGQAEAIVEAMAVADVDPSTIGYLEAHGTGTHLGDPIEIRALARAFGNAPRRSCAIGSVKSNFGHLDGAAGVTGLIKAILSLEHRELPPTLHFQKANPQIDFDATPFYVNDALREWKSDGHPRRAGVSSFGIGGTNAHVVVEEAPAVPRPNDGASHALFVFSARSEGALDALVSQFDTWTHDAAYTLQVGRTAHDHRRAIVRGAAGPPLTVGGVKPAAPLGTVFLFPGQGTQYAGMARELYDTYPAFREALDRCGVDLFALTQEQLEQTEHTQPALFAVEYALAKLWMSLGVQPEAMLGHSIGEYVAACLAGVFSLEDALRLVRKRGALMQQVERGSMIAVPLPAGELLPLLGDRLSLAGVNAPSLCTVSGPTDAIEELERRLTVATRRLHTSHALHSSMMESVLEAFRAEVARVALHPPRIPYVSNVTGTWITAAEATDPAYWATHIRQTVRFSDGVRTLVEGGERIFIEIGPGHTLTSFVRQHGQRAAVASMRHPHDEASELATFLHAVGGAWVNGVGIDWEALHRPHERGRVPLPTYPFERVRHWIEPNRETTTARRKGAIYKRPNVDEWLYVPSWKRTAPVGGDDAEPYAVLFPENAASLIAAVRELRGGAARIAVVTTALRDVTGDEPIDAERAAIAGVCRVIPQEYPNVTLRLIDFDRFDQALLDRELRSGATEPVVAYRNGHRWIETYEHVAPASARPLFRHVLITGANGHFGRAAAEHLGRTCAVTAIDLQEGVDVASSEQMRAALDAARRQHGPIDLVLHAAGTGDGVYQTLDEASAEDFARHLHPKLGGARVLDEILADQPPRMAVITSSLASILGGITLGPYAAADAACDAFAHRGRLPWTSVSFEGWEDLDSAVVGKVQSELMLRRSEMMEALDRVLGLPRLKHVIVSTGDLHARIEQWTHPGNNVGRASARPGRAEARPTSASDTESTIAAIWQETLGVDQVSAEDDFFELGGNSLIGLQILSRLRAEFHVELPLRSFFEARTVAGMARTIEAEMVTGDDEAARMDALLAEIESLSDEEVEAQLSGPAPAAEAAAAPHVCRGMRFSLFFFSADAADRYDLLLNAARFADEHGFDAVWTPERHFVDFGGIYPNPSVLGAALAMATRRVQIRAGSVVLPLHHPIRVAEEWAVVDNLSGGRVAISCATGWHPEDFVLAPERYASRREVMFRNMDEIRRLWRGESVPFRGLDGKDVEVRTSPRPVQRELAMWVTSSGNVDTWVRAGETGANVLATMGNQSPDELADKIRRYRDARRRAGFDPAAGVVSLMLHTFVGLDDEEVRRTVRGPMADYLFTHMQQRDSFVRLDGIREEDKRALTELAFEHYFEQASLLGTPEKCSRMVERLEGVGVDEIACLVDFGVDAAAVLGSLELLDEVRRRHAAAIEAMAEEVTR